MFTFNLFRVQSSESLMLKLFCLCGICSQNWTNVRVRDRTDHWAKNKHILYSVSPSHSLFLICREENIYFLDLQDGKYVKNNPLTWNSGFLYEEASVLSGPMLGVHCYLFSPLVQPYRPLFPPFRPHAWALTTADYIDMPRSSSVRHILASQKHSVWLKK